MHRHTTGKHHQHQSVRGAEQTSSKARIGSTLLSDTRALCSGEAGLRGASVCPPLTLAPEHEADAALWVRCQSAGLPSFRGQRRAFVGRGRGWLRAQERHCDQSSGQFLTVFPPPGLQVGRGQEPRPPTGVTGIFSSVPPPPTLSLGALRRFQFSQQEDGCIRVFCTKDARSIGPVPHT